jgi:hypothetical protein
MYYTVEEITVAMNTAKTIIDERTTGLDTYTRGVNDCFALAVEYTKALTQKESPLSDFSYRDSREFLIKIKKAGYNDVATLMNKCGYKIVTGTRPKYGDIAFEFLRNNIGTAMIASNGCWVSTCEFNTGVIEKRPIKIKESLNVLGRPIKRI